MAVFNAFEYVEVLREAGVPDKQAEAQVKVLTRIMDDEVATKRDIAELKADLKRDIAETRAELKRDMKELEYRMKITLGGMMLAGLGAMVALAKLGLLSPS